MAGKWATSVSNSKPFRKGQPTWRVTDATETSNMASLVGRSIANAMYLVKGERERERGRDGEMESERASTAVLRSTHTRSTCLVANLTRSAGHVMTPHAICFSKAQSDSAAPEKNGGFPFSEMKPPRPAMHRLVG